MEGADYFGELNVISKQAGKREFRSNWARVRHIS